MPSYEEKASRSPALEIENDKFWQEVLWAKFNLGNTKTANSYIIIIIFSKLQRYVGI
jgi:hypothetical protein